MTSSGFGIGRIRWNWLGALAVLLAALPLVYETSTPTLLAIWALFALSLALMWGYAGILSFGHAAYFGLGAYTYAIASFNIGESTVPLLLAIAVPALTAAVIGALMFYGRISDVYLGVMTLVVTLILNRFMNATAGDAYPNWTLEHFKQVVAEAKNGKMVVLQFHGVPDTAHPWVNTPPEMFRQYMQYLKENGYRAIAMRDLIPYFDWSHLPRDPLLSARVVAITKGN